MHVRVEIRMYRMYYGTVQAECSQYTAERLAYRACTIWRLCALQLVSPPMLADGFQASILLQTHAVLCYGECVHRLASGLWTRTIDKCCRASCDEEAWQEQTAGAACGLQSLLQQLLHDNILVVSLSKETGTTAGKLRHASAGELHGRG